MSGTLIAVGWQRAKAASLHHHGIKSAFYKPDVDSPKVPQKRESPTGRESLQDRLVEALESSRPHKVIILPAHPTAYSVLPDLYRNTEFKNGLR